MASEFLMSSDIEWCYLYDDEHKHISVIFSLVLVYYFIYYFVFALNGYRE